MKGDGRMMILELPFYGKRGSISKIVENEKTYSVIEYGIDGKDERIVMVPKKKKNYEELLQNYFQDMKCYLDRNYDQYFEYKSTRLKKKVNRKNIYFGIGISLVSFILGVSLMMIPSMSETIFYIGLVIFAASISEFWATMNLRKEYRKDLKKAEFIEHFNFYSKKLEEYYRSLGYGHHHTPTKFHGLGKESTYNHTIQKKKVKILEIPSQQKQNVA